MSIQHLISSVADIRTKYPTYYLRHKAVENGECRLLSPGEYQKSKTHCPHGHLYSEENTFRRPSGKRECRTCMRVRAQARDPIERAKSGRAWQKRNPIKARLTSKNCYLKRRFGMTLADYEALLAAQSGGCAICGEKCATGFNLAVDHDHKKGHVRGLLCSRCNIGIGHFLDNPERLRAAASYLARQTPFVLKGVNA